MYRILALPSPALKIAIYYIVMCKKMRYIIIETLDKNGQQKKKFMCELLMCLVLLVGQIVIAH